MNKDKHVDSDILAAFTLGALDDEMRRAVEQHLAAGCPHCQAERGWFERTLTLARADDSVEPPPHVLARALRVPTVERLAAERAGGAPRPSLWRRLRAVILFDSQGSATAMAAGTRGADGAPRQVLYVVAELNLEINVQARRLDVETGRIELRGQVFSTDDQSAVADLPISVTTHAGMSEARTSPLGEFALEVSTEAEILVLRAQECEIEVTVPRP